MTRPKSSQTSAPSGGERRPAGITIVSILTILFGLAEVVTAFTHEFLGIATSDIAVFTVSAAVIGVLYVAAGLLILTMRKFAAAIAILLLGADIAGRIALVVLGLYPMTSFKQSFAIVVGTTIAAVFAVYVGSKWRVFR
jgi:hypothetical protein